MTRNNQSSTAAVSRMLNLFACPGDVFAEVAAAPVGVANWVIPLLLSALAGGLLAQTVQGVWLSCLKMGLAATVGLAWSAFLLWTIGRVFLNSRFSFLKGLEIAGLTGIIGVLGAVVTALLGAVLGNASAQPALSLLAGDLSPESHLRAVLGTLNLFHLWAVTVLSIGLARLSGVSFKEAAFWVFGYWFGVRVAVVLLV